MYTGLIARGTVQNASLFGTLQSEGQVCLHCVRVQRSELGSKFGFSYQTLPDSCLLVTNTKPSSSLPLQIGDKILEINGILLPGHKGSTVETVLSKSPSLDVVVVRHLSREDQRSDHSTVSSTNSEKLQQELVMGEVRWQSLRHLLTSLQQKSFDPMRLTGALSSVDDMEDLKTRAVLEMEVEELQRTCADLSNKIHSQQVTLKTKEEVLAALRELTQASRRHAQFVDRLISLVSDRAPWMIDELNSLQDSYELPDTASPGQPLSVTSAGPADCSDAERVIVV
ncbi:hypothetical protein ACOMHN_041497 [Nucella lapillus]